MSVWSASSAGGTLLGPRYIKSEPASDQGSVTVDLYNIVSDKLSGYDSIVAIIKFLNMFRLLIVDRG